VFFATESTFGSSNESLYFTGKASWLEFANLLSYVSFTQTSLRKQNAKKGNTKYFSSLKKSSLLENGIRF